MYTPRLKHYPLALTHIVLFNRPPAICTAAFISGNEYSETKHVHLADVCFPTTERTNKYYERNYSISARNEFILYTESDHHASSEIKGHWD